MSQVLNNKIEKLPIFVKKKVAYLLHVLKYRSVVQIELVE